MRKALNEACIAFETSEIPIGAVVELNGRVIGRGHNLKENNFDPTAHAEIIAIREAAAFLKNWRLGGCNLYVTVEPCPMCAGAIYQARIKTLIYGCDDPLAGSAGSIYNIVQDKRLNHFTEVIGGIYEKECKELLDKFFSLKRK
jgi:tRNA(adenine34) deaminase